MRRSLAILAFIAAAVLSLAPFTHALPAVQNPSLQSVDWITIQDATGASIVHFRLHFVNTDPANPSPPATGSAMAQPFGVFMPDAGPIGSFDVPPIQVNSFFDVFIDIPLQNLPPSAQQIVPGTGPTPNHPCLPVNHWDGNVDVTWNAAGIANQATWHDGKAMVCPGAGNSLIHVVTGCSLATGMSWVMSPLCTGWNATLVEEDMVTPAPNPLPPGWHGFLAISAVAGTTPGTVCCFTVTFNCGSSSSLLYVCATACDCNSHLPGLDGVDWNPVHDTAGGTDIRFHMRFANHDATAPTIAVQGNVNPQMFGAYLPDLGGPIGNFFVPNMAPSSFFDVFFDVPLTTLPPNPQVILPGGGPPAGAPCPADTNWIGNVDVHFTVPAGVPNSTWHNGQLTLCPGGGPTLVHVVTDCAAATGTTWAFSGLCPGFSATLVENDKVTPSPNPLPPGWSGFIAVSATAATLPGVTCCFDMLMDCGGAPARIRVCATTCNCNPALPQLAKVDWANITIPGVGAGVRFHFMFANGNSQSPTAPATGNAMSQMFGLFVPDFGSIGGFSIPSIPPSSFFDVFTEVALSNLPPNPAKVLPGGGPPPTGARPAMASPMQANPNPCPPDSAWQGNVDITWGNPAAGTGQGQVHYHFGQLLVDPGAGNSFIHLITNCSSTTGAAWSFAGVCPGFTVKLFDEDKVTPAPPVLPPGWTGWIAVSSTVVSPGTTCCFRLDLVCNGQIGTIRVCATICDWLGTTSTGPGTVDMGFGIRALAPNPSAGAVLVRFALPEAGTARLEIFSATGQRVRSLAFGPFSAGPHLVMWDAHDDAARKLSPGTYFVRLQMGNRTDSRKVTLVQ